MLESFIILPAGYSEISLFYLISTHCENVVKLSEDNSHRSDVLTLEVG